MNEEIGLAASSAKTEVKIEAKTGEICPQGGIWYPKDCPQHTRSIGIYDRMPPVPEECIEQVWLLKKPTGNDLG